MDGQGTLKGYILRKGKVRGECEALVLGRQVQQDLAVSIFIVPGFPVFFPRRCVRDGASVISTHTYTLVAAHTCALSWKVLYHHCLGIYEGIIGGVCYRGWKEKGAVWEHEGYGRAGKTKGQKEVRSNGANAFI